MKSATKTLMGILFLLVVTIVQVSSEEAVEKPSLRCEGVLIMKESAWAIVGTGESIRVVERGKKLGDYTVTDISTEGITIENRDSEQVLSFSYPIDVGNGERVELELPKIESETVANAILISDFGYVVRALSEAFENDTIVAASASTELVAVIDDRATFALLLAQVAPEDVEIMSARNILVLAPAEKEAKINEIRSLWDSPKEVTLDFVYADLVYVLKVLARESGKDIVIAPDVVGSVTLHVKNAQVSFILPLILEMQTKPPHLVQRDDFLLVGPSSREWRASKAREPDPRLAKLLTLDFVNADLSYVMLVIAQEAGLEAHVQRDMGGAVTITAKNRSLFQLLNAMLEAQESECHWIVKDQKLFVWADDDSDFELVTPESFLDN